MFNKYGRLYVSIGLIIKTVYAIPGDTFRIIADDDGSRLEINGAMAVNSIGTPYLFDKARARMLGLYERDYEGVIPENTYLVLGDAIAGSFDSSRFGLVNTENFSDKVK